MGLLGFGNSSPHVLRSGLRGRSRETQMHRSLGWESGAPCVQSPEAFVKRLAYV